jgi:diguanylate cyclase (GGDEF)-like protein/hemerythrin-like metal-binding protein
MKELIWNEGMSVGIDAIDDDHKQIIAILAKLTSIHSKKVTKETIEGIFVELEDYVSLHFAREEALLEKAGYKDIINHKKSHQKFVEHLPELKKNWLTEDSLACSEKIISFLHHWIVNHILEEDFDYVPTLHTSANPTINRLSNTEKNLANNSVFANVSHTLSQKIKLRKRVFIATFVPVVGVLLLSLVILQDNYQHFKNMSLLLGLNNVIIQVNDISHSLQAERGLSSGVASSNYQNFTPQLLKQRLITDQAITKFLALINNEIDQSVQEKIRFYSEQVRSNFNELAVHRERLDNKSIGFSETYQSYTSLIEQLLSISENLTHVDMNSGLSNNISAISAILVFKEYMGQIRAIGMDMVSGNTNDIYSNLEISLLAGKQLNALHVFHYSANEQQKKLCTDFCDENVHVQMLEQAFAHIMDSHKEAQRSEIWFKLMSGEIDQLKLLTDRLTSNFHNIILAETQRLKITYFAIFAVLSVFIFSAVLFSSVLNFSIINPIRRITDALNSMASGHRNIQFNDTEKKDEIGAMQFAYEKLRRKLLQIDIFQAVVDSQKNEIEYRKTQQEHFEVLAFTDALTGAVNRHQFNKVLAEEIYQANFKRQPLSILLLDIDYFKSVNDKFGHGVGDEVLIMFYKVCKEAARSDDVVARIGGEEFVIILPKTIAQSAYQFAERLREKIQQIDIIIDDKNINVTVSIGVSQWLNESFSCADDFVADADRALYQAKEQGRNRVVG